MKTLIFDVEADFAHFKSYETTRGNYSFPFPPRTAIIGMIAGLLGFPRNEYWEFSHPLRYAKIALEVVNPVERYGLKVNYTRTREKTSIGAGSDRITLHFPNKPTHPGERGFITPIRLDLLKTIYYRVYCVLEEELFEHLANALKNRHFKYPPYLGHANLLAHVTYIGIIEGTQVQTSEMINVDGIISISSLKAENPLVSSGTYDIIYNVPYSQRIHTRSKRFDGKSTFITKTDGIDNFILQTVQGQTEVIAAFKETSLVLKFDLNKLSEALVKEPWSKMGITERIIPFWPISPRESKEIS